MTTTSSSLNKIFEIFTLSCFSMSIVVWNVSYSRSFHAKWLLKRLYFESKHTKTFLKRQNQLSSHQTIHFRSIQFVESSLCQNFQFSQHFNNIIFLDNFFRAFPLHVRGISKASDVYLWTFSRNFWSLCLARHCCLPFIPNDISFWYRFKHVCKRSGEFYHLLRWSSFLFPTSSSFSKSWCASDCLWLRLIFGNHGFIVSPLFDYETVGRNDDSLSACGVDISLWWFIWNSVSKYTIGSCLRASWKYTSNDSMFRHNYLHLAQIYRGVLFIFLFI